MLRPADMRTNEMEEYMRGLAGLAVASSFLLPGTVLGQTLDQSRLHALMSCSVMDITAGHDAFNAADKYRLSDFSLELEVEGDIMLINGSVALEAKANAWNGYRNEATTLLASDEQRFLGILDACFRDAHVVSIIGVQGF
jgi:hypothetical protein